MTDHDDEWWIAPLGDFVIWARLRLLESGVAEVLSADGEVIRYDDEAAARMSLLDAEFRAFDGLDDDDADAFGFDLDSIEPPRGEDDEALLPRMTQKLIPRQ